VIAVPMDVLLPRTRSTRLALADPGGRAGTRTAADIAAAVAVLAYLLITVVVPLAALVATALTRAVGLAPTPANWTLANFSAVASGRTLDALGRSVLLAAAAASVLVTLGGCVAMVERHRLGRPLPHLVTLTLVLPGSTLAIGLLLSYGRWLGDTLVIIWLAYVAKLWAFAHRPVSGALDRLPPDEVYAARGSGASPLGALRTVVLPPLAPALVAAWTVCFLTALHEVTMSSLLYGPGDETMAVVVLNSEELGRVGLTAALCVLLTLAVLVPAVVLWSLVSRLGRGRAARNLVPEPADAG
jgi:iron(III) transport system permease protein